MGRKNMLLQGKQRMTTIRKDKIQKHDQGKAGRDCQNGISLGNVKWAGGKTKSR